MTLNCWARSLSIPAMAVGQLLLPYGVIVHSTGCRPPSDADRNQPSSRTPSDIVTAISWHAGVAAFDGGATNPNHSAPATKAAHPLRHPHLPDLRIPDIDTPSPVASPPSAACGAGKLRLPAPNQNGRGSCWLTVVVCSGRMPRYSV